MKQVSSCAEACSHDTPTFQAFMAFLADMARIQVSCCEKGEAGNFRNRAGQALGNAGWDSCNLFSPLPGQISGPQRQNVTAVS